MKLFSVFLPSIFLGCAATGTVSQGAPADPANADRQAVIALTEQIFSAMRTRDTTALRRMLAPELVIVSVRTAGSAPGVTRRTTVSQFVASIAASREELVERMWDPRVEVRGDIASLWAPYDFYIGGRFSHCGSDALQFVRTNGEWKVVGLVYTAETSACPTPRR